MLRQASQLITILTVLSLPVLEAGCIRVGGAQSEAVDVPMGHWGDWQTLLPLREVAESHCSEETTKALKKAGKHLAKLEPASADRLLAQLANGSDRHWIAVARADLASMYFTTCIRGVAWRIEDAGDEGLPGRSTDFSPDRKIEAGDMSVEAMLTNLDAAIASGVPALETQGRIARSRVTAFSAQCPANETVSERSANVMKSDLANLAAKNQLTPDLAYLWAGVQMEQYSGSVARPFLLQAKEGGFDNPSVDLTLAMIAFEQREYDEARRLAELSAAAFAELGQPETEARAHLILAEVAMSQKEHVRARGLYIKVLELLPADGAALLGLAKLNLKEKGAIEAGESLSSRIHSVLPPDSVSTKEQAEDVIFLIESITLASGDQLELADLVRESLLIDLDSIEDPAVQGIFYFYAAMLEVRLGDYEAAKGHALLAEGQLQESAFPQLLDVRGFLRHLEGGV